MLGEAVVVVPGVDSGVALPDDGIPLACSAFTAELYVSATVSNAAATAGSGVRSSRIALSTSTDSTFASSASPLLRCKNASKAPRSEQLAAIP